MPNPEWYSPILTLLGGGAAGSIITLLTTSIKNRIQPVSCREEILPIFKKTLSESSLINVSIINDGRMYQFQNLFLINIQITNQGNKDILEFPFGITLGPYDKIVYIEKHSSDRFHSINQVQTITPEIASNEIDFILEPFNRRDSYFIKLYVVITEVKDEPEKPKYGSSYPVKFIKTPTVNEVAARIAESTTFTIGGISMSFKKH